MVSGEHAEDKEYVYEEPPESEASQLLDKILDQTKQVDTGEIDGTVRRLAIVAQRDGEEIVSLQGLTELVKESVRDYAQAARLSEQTWENLSSKVADALFDDPSARDRLDRLWKHITEIRI